MIQTDEYWQNAIILDHEKVRKALRDLLKFIDKELVAEIEQLNGRLSVG